MVMQSSNSVGQFVSFLTLFTIGSCLELERERDRSHEFNFIAVLSLKDEVTAEGVRAANVLWDI